MKTSEFKKLIKEAVKEVIQEELREILLEAIKAPKQTIRESYTPVNIPNPPSTYTEPTFNARDKYRDILGETSLSFTTRDIQSTFNPQGVDPMSGNLPGGELNMDQIMGLLKK